MNRLHIRFSWMRSYVGWALPTIRGVVWRVAVGDAHPTTTLEAL